MTKDFQPIFAPTEKPRRFGPKAETYSLLKDAFKPHTIILIGSLLQIILSSILPLRWAIVPPLILLLNSIITTICQVLSPRPNEYNVNVLPGRATAQIPRPDGSFENSPSPSPLVVFQLGAQWNHPLGILAPGVAELNGHVQAMIRDIQNRREEFGYLTSSVWRSDDRRSNNTVLVSFYFRDVQGLHNFAHDDLHRAAWDWWNKTKYPHIGIYHETYCVPARSYEGVYVNCSPLLLGRLASKVDDTSKDGQPRQDEWVNGLVSADTPALKTQWARLSRDENGVPKEDA